MSTLVPLGPGTVFAKDFRVIRPLAEGGMGAVYVVEQLSTGKERALKTMHPNLVQDPMLREKFVNEAKVASRIESDHIVEVVGAGVDDMTGSPWLAMELLRGQNLADYVEKEGPRGAEESVELLRQLGHAIGAAHRAGLVHRDLKPENVFLAETRRDNARHMVKVLDFGIAKVVQDVRAATATQAMGSPFWMAPEQTETRGQIGPPTDVWAIGLLGFYLLTGRSFWMAGNQQGAPIQALMREMLFDPIPSASERAKALGAPTLPGWFDGWFAGCVVRDFAKRFPDATACIHGMSNAVAGLPPGRSPTVPVVGVEVPAGMVPPTVAMEVVDPAALGGAPVGATQVTVAKPGAVPATVVGAPSPLLAKVAGAPPAEKSKMPWVVGGLVALFAVGAGAAIVSRGRGHEGEFHHDPPQSVPTVVSDAGPAAEPTVTVDVPAVAQPSEPVVADVPVVAQPTEPVRRPTTPVRRPTTPTTPAVRDAGAATLTPTPTQPTPTQPQQPDLGQIVQQLGRNPEVMFARARALEQTNQRQQAIRAYEEYLAANPNGQRRAEAERRLAALRAQPEGQPAAPTP